MTCGGTTLPAGSFMQINTPARSVADKIHMMLHHMFTILLMVFSWTCNFVRVGTLVFFVHECVDIPLLFAKMLLYAGIQRLTDVIFAVFLISWLITRNYLYPFWIMYSVFVDATPYIQMPAAYLFKGLLIGLLVLNIIWTVLIGGVLMKKLCVGSLEDVRSDGEDLSEDDNTRGSCDKRKQE
ncbi:LAG1 longevity assurance 3-like [Homarus americanus]|uniref:LAG1 longevity assurance 3-like n=2 Tax=Homarus americanus TaxID=6706 RepID=A0A8J5JHL6_HOMAM|nr:LAG1 longevity assurance 3-like [Homarus americanus]